MNMNDMLKQAQNMQKEVEKAKSQIDESVFTSEKGKNVVVHMYGTKVIKEVEIDDVAMQDREILQDLIAIAANDCVKQINDFTEEKMSTIAPGLGGLL